MELVGTNRSQISTLTINMQSSKHTELKIEASRLVRIYELSKYKVRICCTSTCLVSSSAIPKGGILEIFNGKFVGDIHQCPIKS